MYALIILFLDKKVSNLFIAPHVWCAAIRRQEMVGLHFFARAPIALAQWEKPDCGDDFDAVHRNLGSKSVF